MANTDCSSAVNIISVIETGDHGRRNIISTWFRGGEGGGGVGMVVGVPLRFSKLPRAPWMSHYHDFSQGNFSLLNKTQAYIQTHESAARSLS